MNMLNYLTFDRDSIALLLNCDLATCVDPQFPVFYKARNQRSAIDVALDLNQVSTVRLFIKYIVQYQSSAMYAHLFHYNIVDMVKRGIEVYDLFNSKIFNMDIEFIEWPSLSEELNKEFSYYNKSMFKLRYEFPNIYPKYQEKIDRAKQEGAG